MFFSPWKPRRRIHRPRASIKFFSLGILLLALPLQYVPTDPDSSETNFSISGGAGSYGVISRGCEGQVLEKHKINFSELGGSIDHKFAAAPLRIGVRSGYVNDRVLFNDISTSGGAITQSRRENIFTINPFLNIEGKTVALGIGYFHADHSLAGTDDVSRINPGSAAIYASVIAGKRIGRHPISAHRRFTARDTSRPALVSAMIRKSMFGWA